RDVDASLQILQRLDAMGVRISIDDFGTGYSSLSYLRKMPFDKIKIDQSFVRDLPHNRGSLAIIRAVMG
uniref:EAL domain-containing protein n=1 Tax=Escherichia coli TaxID=562 RepID=UPI0013D6520F